MQNDDIDGGAVAAGLDRRATGIARGGADDGDALAALVQHMIEQPPQHLQRVVLEGRVGP